MNCSNIMNAFIDKVDYDLADVTKGFEDEWNENYAYVIVDLMEEDFRDYDGVLDYLFETLRELAPEAEFRSCRKRGYSETSKYEVEYNRSDLSCEFILYNVEWMKNKD